MCGHIVMLVTIQWKWCGVCSYILFQDRPWLVEGGRRVEPHLPYLTPTTSLALTNAGQANNEQTAIIKGHLEDSQGLLKMSLFGRYWPLRYYPLSLLNLSSQQAHR